MPSRRAIWVGMAGVGALSLCAVLVSWPEAGRAEPAAQRDSAASQTEPSARSHDLDQEALAHLVGKETCGTCHAKQKEAHATSAHSRTFFPSNQSEYARSLGGQTFKDPERNYTYKYKFDPQQGLSVSIPEKFEREVPLQYVMGGGEEGRSVSFLGLLPSAQPGQPTSGFEHRISFGPKKPVRRLKITFGQQGRELRSDQVEIEHFGRYLEPATLQACVDCHVTSGKVQGTTIVDFRQHVTCESCHGPGSKHVAAAQRGVDRPGHLKLTPGSYTAEQQLEQCGRCHRVAEMCPSHMIGRDKLILTRFQSAGMAYSRCFRESSSGMGCTTCHDHHRGLEHDEAVYAAKCLKCHQAGHPEFTSCPVSSKEGCVKCHMPAVPWLHGSLTDHWIRVRDERDPAPPYDIPRPQKKRD